MINKKWDTAVRNTLIEFTGLEPNYVLQQGQITGPLAPEHFCAFSLQTSTMAYDAYKQVGHLRAAYDLRYVVSIYGSAAIELATQIALGYQLQKSRDILHPAGMTVHDVSIMNSITEYIGDIPYNRVDMVLELRAVLDFDNPGEIDKVNIKGINLDF